MLAGCTSAEDDYDVAARDDRFEPDALDTEAGVEVVWKNLGGGTHTVTIQDPAGGPGPYLLDQEDPALAPGDTASFVFDEPGTYDVFCRYHSQGAAGDFSGGMVMTVVVA